MIATLVFDEVKRKFALKFTTMTTIKNTKRKNENDMINAIEEPLVKASKTEANIRSLKKADIVLKFEELKVKYESLCEENEKLKKENDSNLAAINVLEEKAEKLQDRVQGLLSSKDSSNAASENCPENYDEPECDICWYPAKDLCDLGAHIYEWHAEANWREVFQCSICDMRYPCKNELMNHRKNNHFELVPVCRNYLKGRCHFENCWYKHEKSENETSDLKCGFCGKNLQTKNDLMNHVKENHKLKVKKCEKFIEGNCVFKDRCWYKHDI